MFDFIKNFLSQNKWLLLASFFVISLLTYKYQFGQFYGIIDFRFPELNIKNNFFHPLYWWGDFRGSGELQSVRFPMIVERMYVGFLSLFISSPVWLNFFKQFVLNFSFFLVTYFTLRSFAPIFKHDHALSKKWSIIIALFAVMNMYFLQSNQIVQFLQRFDYIAFCLLIIAVNRIVISGKGILVYALVCAFSLGTWNLFPYWLPYLAIIFIYAIYLLKSGKIAFRDLCILALIYIGFNLSSIISILYYSLFVNLTASVEYAQEVLRQGNRTSEFFNAFSFIGGVNWGRSWNWNDSQVFSYYSDYSTNYILILARYIPIVIFIILIYLTKQSRSLFGKLILFLIVIFFFFVAANNEPFGFLYTIGFENSILFKIYRESHNKFYPALIFLISLFTFLQLMKYDIRSRLSKFIQGAFAVYFICFVYTIAVHSYYSQNAFFDLPESYQHIQQHLDFDSIVLVLPEYRNLRSYTYDHYGVSPLQNTISNPSVLTYNILESSYNHTFYDRALNDFNFKKGSGAYVRGSINPKFDTDLLRDTGINYIVLDGYVNGTPEYTRAEFAVLKGAIDKSEDFYLKAQEGELYVYEKKDREAIIQGQDVNFFKVNPTHYQVRVNSLETNRYISLLQSFDKGWSIVLNKYSDDKFCLGDSESFVSGESRCHNSQSFFSSVLFSLFDKKYADDSHVEYLGYANQWNLDPDVIKRDYNNEYYNQNDDGSIDIDLNIYYVPQSYLFFSFFGALFALILAILIKIRMVKFMIK